MKVVSISLSEKKGTRKHPMQRAELIQDHGLKGDAHAGTWHRQVSLLAAEAIERARNQGIDVGFGDFAENIATIGIDWPKLPVGSIVKIGNDALIQITQIGKRCHTRCAIYHLAGQCIMPREGVFARVMKGGEITTGDSIEIIDTPRLSLKCFRV